MNKLRYFYSLLLIFINQISHKYREYQRKHYADNYKSTRIKQTEDEKKELKSIYNKKYRKENIDRLRERDKTRDKEDKRKEVKNKANKKYREKNNCR